MKCPFAGCGCKDDITEFDKAVEHLIIVFNANGYTHIHGPFGNEYAIRKMADALITEMQKNKIDYKPPERADILSGD